MKQNHAGLSIVYLDDGKKTIAFHGTKIDKKGKRHCIWMEIPVHAEVYFFALPHIMDRVDACRHLLKQDALQVGYIQTFLHDMIEKYRPLDEQEIAQKKKRGISKLKESKSSKKSQDRATRHEERAERAERREERAESREQRHENREQTHENHDVGMSTAPRDKETQH